MSVRLVLLVEGDGDVDAVPVLVKKLFSESRVWNGLTLDPAPMKVGEFSGLVKNDCADWLRYLQIAGKRKNVGACLLLLDGDSRAQLEAAPFCASRAAIRLVERARSVGAGGQFSLAVVFACMEFESWLLAGAESLAGKRLPDGRRGVKAGAKPPTGDLEKAPRNAKGWFRKEMEGGYNPTRDQAILTSMVDVNVIRQRGLRSFRRIENAVSQLASAIRTGNHTATPFTPEKIAS